MIQRIQSVFMAISIALIIAAFFIPLGYFSDTAESLTMTAYGVKDAAGTSMAGVNTYWFIIPLTLALAVTIKALFGYKSRVSQLRDLRLSFVALAFSFLLMAFYVNSAQGAIVAKVFSMGIGFFMPFGALIFNWLAARAIRKDEALIKSVDRIR